jgi:ABC-2 type transport system ATP-binding protein
VGAAAAGARTDRVAGAAGVLTIAGVTKSYGDRRALDDVTLAVPAGTVIGLLGPNGAGKTTLISIVAGLRRPDRGSVAVGGVNVGRDPRRARGLIGLAPQDTGVYLPLTVRENLTFFAALAGVRGRERARRIDELAGALLLDSLMDRRVGALSGGERRRLHTAIALVHRPPLVLLDEPTTGADVTTRAQLLTLVRALADDGAAVVYSTHYLPEVETLHASVAFIDRGRIVAQGPLDDLVHRYGTSALELVFERDVPPCVRIDGAMVEDRTLRVPTDDPSTIAAQLLGRLGSQAGTLRAIEIVRPTLDSVFAAVTGRRYRDADEMTG